MSDHDGKVDPQREPSFLIEVKDLHDAGGRFELHAGRDTAKKIVGATEDMLAAVRNAVTDVCHMAYGAFQAANRPDEVSVKFSVTLGAKAGGGWVVFVTEASGQATLEFTAKWTNPKPDTNPKPGGTP